MKFLLKISLVILSFNLFAQTDSLVLHLSFDGGDLTDQSIYKNTVNSISITPGEGRDGLINGSASFDGNGSRIIIPDFPEFEPPVTFSFWMKKIGSIEDTPNLGDLEGLFYKQRNTGLGLPFGLTLAGLDAPHSLHLRTDVNNDFQQIKADSLINPEDWHFVVAQFDTEKISLYSDFELRGELDLPSFIVDNSEDLILGAIGNNFGGFYQERYFQGLIDEFKIFNKVIPIDDFIENPITDSLILHISFDQGDLSDNSNYKNLVNSESISKGVGVDGNSDNSGFFDGEISKIFIPDFKEFEPPLTFSFWMKKEGNIEDTPGLGDLEGLFYKQRNTGLGLPFGLTLAGLDAPHSLHLRTDVNNDFQQVKVGGLINPDEWHFVVTHFDNEKISLYSDFELRGELDLPSPIIDNFEDLILGAIGNNFGGFYSERYYQGYMDEFKIFNQIIPIDQFEDISPVQNLNTVEVVVFPNPAYDYLNVLGLDVSKIEILNLQGKSMILEKNKSRVDISTLSKGIFIVKIYSVSGYVKKMKFIKM